MAQSILRGTGDVVGWVERRETHRGPRRRHEHVSQPLRYRARQERGQLCAADPDRLSAAQRRGLSEPARRRAWGTAVQLAPGARTLPPAGVGAFGARGRAGRHRRRDGAEHSRGIRGAFRGADGRGGAERAQYPPRSGYNCLHPRARRGQGADHRYRIRAGGRAGTDAARTKADCDRHRRCERTGRRAARRDGVRRVSHDGRLGFSGGDARRRVGRNRAQLHLGHDRQPERRRLSPSRRLPERARQRPCLGHAAAPGLSVDLADVSLQRLVLPVDDHGDGRHACLPAPGRGGGDLRGDRARRRHASVRRAGRHEHAAECGARSADARSIAASR